MNMKNLINKIRYLYVVAVIKSGILKHCHLHTRVSFYASILRPYQSQYRVLFEDPDDMEAPAKVLVPDPNWMAAALNGSVLPDISAYIADQNTLAEYKKQNGSLEGFNWRDYNPQHPYAEPRGPMTEEEAIEYLIQKDIPPSVWRDYEGNRTVMKIVPVELIPTDRSFRNAWVIAQDKEEEMETAV
jgi:hypothetical protein